MKRVLLLIPNTSYRAADFMAAAERLGIEVAVGSNHRQALEDWSRGGALSLDFTEVDISLRRIVDFARARGLSLILATDDETTLVAAKAAAALGLPHNPPEAIATCRDKVRQRTAWASAGLPTPRYRRIPVDGDPTVFAGKVSFPCVLKPVSLSASRGVLRADNPEAFVAAHARVAKIIHAANGQNGTATEMLVEDYIPGREVAVEGLMDDGHLRLLALFDKPDPMIGPAFEETLYVTPSRLPAAIQTAVFEFTARAFAAVGLRDGPIHAELRINDAGIWPLEVAARSIGGLCGRVLRFGTGLSLEEVVLRHALGPPIETPGRESRPAGVMMLPIPRAGILRRVDGVLDARRVAGVEDLTLTIPLGGTVVPPPEGDRYLGFLFARADTPAAVEAALREAHGCLSFQIEPA